MSSQDPTFVAYQQAHYRDDKRAGIIISNIVLLVLAYLAVLLKFLARRVAHTDFRSDDYWNWGSLVWSPSTSGHADIDRRQVVFNFYICGNFVLVHYGLGLHIIRVNSLKGFVIVGEPDLHGFDKIRSS